MSVTFKRGPAPVEANLTPMIDVTFLLIVFFVLVSQIVEVESVPMNLPEPTDAATVRPGDDQRAVINVMPGPGGEAAGYRLGSRMHPPTPEGVAALTAQLSALLAANPQMAVNLRADRLTHYDQVEPVLESISNAAAAVPEGGAAARVNLVVIHEQ